MARRKNYDGPSSLELLDAYEQKMLDRILDDIDKQGPNWVRSWSNPTPRNPASGTVYQGRNNLILTYAMRENGWHDPRFITPGYIRAAQKSGLEIHIKKGSEGTRCEKWRESWYNTKEKAFARPQPKPGSAEEKALAADPDYEKVLVHASPFVVFNAAQVEGFEEVFGPFEVPSRDTDLDPFLDSLEEQSPCRVEEVPSNSAWYLPARDYISVPQREQFTSREAFARTLLHEQCHATGHVSRLDRKQDNRFGSQAYAFEELIAEMGALFTANKLGLDLSHIECGGTPELDAYYQDHVAYLKSWTQGTDKPKEALMRAAGQAGRACGYLMKECDFDGLRLDALDLSPEHEVELVDLSEETPEEVALDEQAK